MRPLLLPALSRLWRDRSTLQLGADPIRAVLVCDLPPGAGDLLDRLDGMTDLDTVLAGAAAGGLRRDLATQLIGVLVRAGAVIDTASSTPFPAQLDAPARQRLRAEAASLSLLGKDPGGVLTARHARMVAVHGCPRLAVPLAAALGAAGVGRVHVTGRGVVEPRDVAPGGLGASDISLLRPAAAAAAVSRVAPEVDTRPLPPRRPADLAVVTGRAAYDADLVARLVTDRVAHLVVAVRDTTGVVGPLVRPGLSSCLHCAYLHRQDRDPAWPALSAQLATAPRSDHEAHDTALGTMIVGLAATQALAHLDGAAVETLDGTLEVALPDCRVRRRSWPPHPECGCLAVTLGRAG